MDLGNVPRTHAEIDVELEQNVPIENKSPVGMKNLRVRRNFPSHYGAKIELGPG